MDGRLSSQDYLTVIERSHLISVDVIAVCDEKVLVGERKNEPAKGTLFVPGCRMYKKESLEECLARCLDWEMGIDIKQLDPRDIEKVGCYIHTYDNNFENDNFGTKYLVFPFVVELDSKYKETVGKAMLTQHDSYEWMSVGDLLQSDKVHNYTKYYFMLSSPNKLL